MGAKEKSGVLQHAACTDLGPPLFSLDRGGGEFHPIQFLLPS